MVDISNLRIGERISIKNGQIQVILPGNLNLAGLTRELLKNGFFVASTSPGLDSQGWGEEQDLAGYYPYWVYRDDNKWVFAFTPERFKANEDKIKHTELGGKRMQ